MEHLITNITTTCPPAFAGATGSVFAQAIAAVVAAQCAITDEGWPKDAALDVMRRVKEGFTYDFIIVGAGTAGSLLAMRLSDQFPTWNILLIEAGDDPGPDSEVPSFLFLNQNTGSDWSYKTEPSDYHCKGFRQQQCIWSKGKGMGGSSSINAMLYIRGHPEDFELWKTNRNTNWGYKDVEPFFDKIEKMFNTSGYKNDLKNPWYDLLRKAWNDIGYSNDENRKNEAVHGTKISKLLVSNGKRLNTAKYCLKSVSRNNNLHIMKNTKVQRLIIDIETRSVQSVEIQQASGTVMQIKANKEVVLSAGSVATPQILMLSGIGPADHLRDIGIDKIVELPVGKNLQDHPIFPLLLQIDQANSNELPTEILNLFLVQYILLKTGPFATIGITDFMCFINTKNQTKPDIQYHHTFFPKNDKIMLYSYFEGVGYSQQVLRAIVSLNEKHSLLGIFPTLLRPISRGEILLANTDPSSKPLIKANYFKEPDDMKTMIDSIREVQKLLNTSNFKQLGIKLPRLGMDFCSNFIFDSEKYWQCYIEHLATTIYHPVGTTRMGPEEDNNSVVDSSLLIHGIKNLRLVDASIMPYITGGNTMAPTLMIAEKAADLIIKKYNFKEEL